MNIEGNGTNERKYDMAVTIYYEKDCDPSIIQGKISCCKDCHNVRSPSPLQLAKAPSS